MESCPSPERSTNASPAPAGVPSGLPLVVLLTGFTDAGSAVSGLIEHLTETTDPEPLLVFDNDVLLDYRARRPVLTFDQDHIAELRPARLELSLAHDALGQPFLLLSGYEPDFAWNAFADVVLDFAAEHEVVHGDLGARDRDAGAAHPADRRHGQRQPGRAHRRALRLASAHPGAGHGRAPAGVPVRAERAQRGRASCC